MTFTLRTSSGQETAILGPLRIGRAAECEIQLADSLASRVHATVWVEDGQLLVRDQRSSNGTFVNGRPLAPSVPSFLAPGDLLRIGNTTFTVAVGTGPTPAPQPRPPVLAPGGPLSVTDRVPMPIAGGPAPMPPSAPPKQARPWRAIGLGVGIVAIGVVLIVLLVAAIGIAVVLLRHPALGGPPAAGQTPTAAASTTIFEKQDVTLATSADNQQVTKQTTTCTGSIVYEVTGGVYPDVDIVIPKNTSQ